MSSQRVGVNQLLGVTPNRWPTNFFLGFSSWISHEPLVRMMEKVLFHHFPMFFIIFDHANSCASMHLLVEIHNKRERRCYLGKRKRDKLCRCKNSHTTIPWFDRTFELLKKDKMISLRIDKKPKKSIGRQKRGGIKSTSQFWRIESQLKCGIIAKWSRASVNI